jgi:hypothetical protein
MPDSTPPSRLSEIAANLPVDPFRHAANLTRCELYWLPASLPATEAQRRWTLQFLTELVKGLAPKGELNRELFIELEAIYPDRQDEFIQSAMDFNPVMGFSRRPGAPLPSIPNSEDIAAIRRQEKEFVLKSFLQGICYWFLRKAPDKQLELFWGFGGMTMLLVKPDPSVQPPPIEIPPGVKKHPAFKAALEKFDLQEALGTAFTVQSGFLRKSKEYFGTGWESRLEYKALLYILPKWQSRDFFSLPEDAVNQLFEICELFVAESPADKGVILASKKPLRTLIHDVIVRMREAGFHFPDGA